MSMLNYFYNASPVFIQNVLITLKNMEVYYNKYGLIPFFQSTKYLQKKLLSSNIEINDDYNLKKINKLINYSRNNSDRCPASFCRLHIFDHDEQPFACLCSFFVLCCVVHIIVTCHFRPEVVARRGPVAVHCGSC